MLGGFFVLVSIHPAGQLRCLRLRIGGLSSPVMSVPSPVFLLALLLSVALGGCAPAPKERSAPLTIAIVGVPMHEPVREVAELFTSDTGVQVRIVSEVPTDRERSGAAEPAVDLLLADEETLRGGLPHDTTVTSASATVVALAPPVAPGASTQTVRLLMWPRPAVHPYAREFRGRMLGDEGRAVLEKHGLAPPDRAP